MFRGRELLFWILNAVLCPEGECDEVRIVDMMIDVGLFLETQDSVHNIRLL